MLPSSSSGSSSTVASFSFLHPATQTPSGNKPGPNSSTQPPSDLLLCSTTTKTATARLSDPDLLSTLPTMLIYLIKNWLIDRDSLTLILASQRMGREVQSYYQLRLRATAATRSAIAACQNTVNLKPSLVFMGLNGEQMFQQCLALQSPDRSEEAYRDAIIELLSARLSLTKDLDEFREVFTAAGLALGGTVMTAENRDALLSLILASNKTNTHREMGVMIQGICAAIGPRLTKSEHHLAVCDQILASYKTSSSSQMASMMRGLCIFFGGVNMSDNVRRFVITKIVGSYQTIDARQMRGMIYTVCLALGGKHMALRHRDGLLQQVLALYGTHRDLPLDFILQGLFKGFGDTEMRFDGRDMKPADINAVLERILDCHEIWTNREMGIGVGALCVCLGGMTMLTDNRDRVLTKILNCYETCSADQMGAMILSLCSALGGKTPGGVNHITHDNLATLLSQILAAHALISQEQMGALVHYLFRALGQAHITAQHRALLVTHIQKSGRAREIMAAVKLTFGGQDVVDFLAGPPQ